MKNIIRYICSLCLLTGGLSVAGMPGGHSGAIDVTGDGQVSAPPDYVRLSIDVTSVCYDSSSEALAANAELAQKLLAVLNEFRVDSRDNVSATPGRTLPETIYGDEVVGGRRQPICVRKWETHNTLTLRTAVLANTGEILDRLFKTIDTEGLVAGKVKQTYAQVSDPQFALFPETQQKLEIQAQDAALSAARAKFDAFAAKCGFTNPVLVKLSSPTYELGIQQGQAQAGNVGTPIIPEKIVVHATWRFSWKFEQPNAICEIE